MSDLTGQPRSVQTRRLYAALRQAGYLTDENDPQRFAIRISAALYRLGFVVLVLSDEQVEGLPEDFSADTELIGGDQDGHR